MEGEEQSEGGYSRSLAGGQVGILWLLVQPTPWRQQDMSGSLVQAGTAEEAE